VKFPLGHMVQELAFIRIYGICSHLNRSAIKADLRWQSHCYFTTLKSFAICRAPRFCSVMILK
jgi:hypothetical protein